MQDQARVARGAWRRFSAAWHRLLSLLLAVSVAILIVPVSLQILSRHTSLIPSYIWTEEMARFMFVWLIMIGAMVAMREGTHFVVDVWPKLSPRADAALGLVSGAGVLLFALVFVYAGWEFTAFAMNRISELAELPLWLIHVAWPLLGVTWLAFHGERMVDLWRVFTGRIDRLPH
jgi:TRAP-type transport system small permease protein